ncbi:unnamed protein product [Cylindrotheca closterium]|uniref:G-protein coupled receptors family 3 profile domain-containing protein n=1 Tax=Cylindrotheca closterium TaxID=2856 RepID=A0AAD2CDI9_9STRA|nr:unnamed protein product [Cylindrotheca closterium]
MSDNATSVSPTAAPVAPNLNSTEIPSSAPTTAIPTDSPSSLPSAEISPSPSFAITTSDDNCDCSNCSSTSPQDTETSILKVVTPPEFVNYLQYHITGFQQLNPNVLVQVEVVNRGDDQEDPFRALQQRLLLGDDDPWDGAMFPSQLVGSLDDELWELDDYLTTSTTHDVLPFFQRYSLYGNATKIMPLDGNIARMFYRKDLLEQHNVTVPRTWDEYEQVTQYFDQNTEFQGSCVSTCGTRNNADWAFLVLSTMTQTMGSSSGFLFDPITSQPVWGDAMEETLRLFSGHGHEATEDCQGGRFSQGECALTYTWDGGIFSYTGSPDIGVAPTPGSPIVMDRVTGQLENCTPSLCPFGEQYDDIGIVNRAPYSAFGSWVSGVSNSTANNREMADFFSYLQSQSFQDVLPNERTTLLDSYQYKHTEAYRWINDGGVAPTIADEYTESSRAMNSLNAVMHLRMPNADAFFNIFDEEVSSYMSDIDTKPNLEFQESMRLREKAATRMTARVENLIASQPEFTSSYQDSIGFLTAPREAFNYIDEDYRTVAWGMSGLIIVASISLIFWTILFRKNPVMRAFQPFLLIQCAVGVLLMGVTILLIGLDDQMFDQDFLDFTCMAGPWAYVVGFTIFYSSVYCKIEECTKMFRDPKNNKVLFVSLGTDAQLTSRLLFLNGAILAAWTVSDPLRWVRQELDGGMIYPDGTVETYGMCRGGEFTSFAFASVLYFLNMFILAIGIVRALKCRFLVLEYNELQWLTLSLLPFLESWMIGGSVLAISRDNPTVVFSSLAFVITVSAVCAGLAIFAPKDWYVRKHKYMETRSRKETEHTTSGILLLQHPKFENQKLLDNLQIQLRETLTHNTELEIEIRGMQERFRELNYMNEQYANSQRTVRALASPRASRLSYGATKIPVPAQIPELQVWKMPDDEDETEVDLTSEIAAGPLESFSPMNKGQVDYTNKTSNGLPTSSVNDHAKAIGAESALDDLVNGDDVEALGSKADKMANKFKASAGRALIGDGVDQTNLQEMMKPNLFSNQRKPGEPSGDDSYTKEEEKRRSQRTTGSTGSASKESSPPSSGNLRLSPQDSAKRSGVSFKPDTQFNAAAQETVPTPYNMGEWSAVGVTGGVLVDMSDTSSYSSNTSSAQSATSMEATMRASALDTPFAKEIDNLVAKKDWDGLQLVAKSYEPSSAIDEKKRRKRELEASFAKTAISRTSSGENETHETHWA